MVRIGAFFKDFFYSPLIGAAVICSLFIYTGIAKRPAKNTFRSLLPPEQISRLSGTVISNAAKTSGKPIYVADFQAATAEDNAGASSACTGTVRIYIPAHMAEAFFPDKLYSAAKTGTALICEKGAKLNLTGSFTKDGGVFFVKTARQLAWEQNLRGRIQFFRAICRAQFRRMLFAWGDAGGLLLALLSGMREYTDARLVTAFRNAGLSHILALSGMHLSLFSGIAAFIGKNTGGRPSAPIAQFAAIALFTWFAGFSPSLFRAFLCALIVLACRFSKIPPLSMPNVLALAFLIHASLFPAHLFNAAFLLSYGALTGILLFSELCTRTFITTVPPPLAVPLGASVGAQCGTAPLSLACFGAFAPIGAVSTVVVSPFVTFFIYSGLACILACLAFPALTPYSAAFMGIQYTLIKRLALLFAGAPLISF